MNSIPFSDGPKSPAWLFLAGTLLAAAGTGEAQQLYSEDFDVNHTANWTVNSGAGNNDADFFFDYSSVGIPSAPRSTGGTTRGVKLRANFATVGVFTGVSVSPNNQSFSGNYRLTFDFWSNFNGNANGTGNGTTQLTGAGIGTDGITPQHANVAPTSLWFCQTGDGGNSAASKDYRAYSSVTGAGTGYTLASGVYAAGTGTTAADNANAYYVSLGANTVPAAQTALAATQLGTTAAGAPAFKWHTGEILKVGNTVRYSIDGLLIFTVDASTVTLSGDNIELIQSDINSGVSTDLTAPVYAFGLFDNITVSNVPSVVSVAATTPTASESGPTAGSFTMSRTGDASLALTVNYLLSGTAVNGVDYTTLPGTATFAAGASTANIAVTPIDDLVPEFVETVVFTIDAGAGYFIGSPNSATMAIIDNDPATIAITNTQPVMLEGFGSNRVPVTVTRTGLTNGAVTVNLNYTGSTATPGADFNGPGSVALAAGATTTNFDLTPIDDKIDEGTESIVVNIGSGGYATGSPAAATINITDDDLPPAVTMFADAFDSDTSANWTVNPSSLDAYADFGFDYSTVGIPEAPSSTNTFIPQRGLKLHVNELGAQLASISVSPLNGYFTNNYRLRFDLWLNYAGPLNNPLVPGQTQTGSAGVGTTGVETMWPSGSATEGVWFSVTGDGGNGSPTGDYNVYSGVTPYSTNSGVFAAGTAGNTKDNANVYYAPWNAVSAPATQTNLFPTQSGTTLAGSLGMAWHSVSITRRGANVTWDVDGRRLATVDTTALSLSTDVFLGYHDPFASLTTNAPVQFGLFDNVRVETLSRPIITDIQIITDGTQVQVDFSAESGDTADLFDLLTAATANGAYTPVSATTTSLGGNKFRAVTPLTDNVKHFYRFKRK